MKEIHIYRRNRFFDANFPLAVRHEFNRTEDFNESKRFQREFWKITSIVAGEGDFVIDSQKYPVSAQSIFLSHPNATTTYAMKTPVLELFNIVFDPVLIAKELAELNDDFQFFAIFSGQFSQSGRPAPYILNGGHEIEALVRGMAREFEHNAPNRKALLKYKLLELLILLLRRSERRVLRHNPAELVRYVDAIIREQYAGTISTGTLAKNLGVTTNHLCRTYLRYSNRCIGDALREYRLEKAKYLLAHSQYSIAEICYRCGFSDLSYFYRAFRAHFNSAPGDMRKIIGQN